jgi:superfamily I DNA and/or RNA helicase
VSLFETLCTQRPEAQVVLRTQHRMCGPIMDLNNEITYNHTLRAASPQVADARLRLPGLSNVRPLAPYMYFWC